MLLNNLIDKLLSLQKKGYGSTDIMLSINDEEVAVLQDVVITNACDEWDTCDRFNIHTHSLDCLECSKQKEHIKIIGYY